MERFISYAIGDVHGMADQLRLLHAQIRDDIAVAAADDGAEEGVGVRIVHLGDYVDRGPDSHGVIEAVMAFEAEQRALGREVVSLRGNHEQMMLDACAAPNTDRRRYWFFNGGDVTVDSYIRAWTGAGKWKSWVETIPPAHLDWLNSLPTLFTDPARKLAFVHAGIDPGTYPNCPDEVRIWTRADRFLDFTQWPDRMALKGLKVIHGHTPQENLQPEIQRHRINVDTGCVYGGQLTAVALEGRRKPRFLAV